MRPVLGWSSVLVVACLSGCAQVQREFRRAEPPTPVVRLYAGPARPPAEVATLRVKGHGLGKQPFAILEGISGMEVQWRGASPYARKAYVAGVGQGIEAGYTGGPVLGLQVLALELLPGTYSIRVSYLNSAGSVAFVSTEPCAARLEAKPGHAYLLDARGASGFSDLGTWSLVVQDSGTGETLATVPGRLVR